MSQRILGAPPPPEKQRMDVIRITAIEPMQLVCVSLAPFGQPVHWFGRRSHECKAERGSCKGCESNWPLKWQAYLHVMSPMRNWQGFLEITRTAYLLLDAQVPEDTNYRGVMFRISKTKGGAKGRYLIDVLPRRVEEGLLPQAKDPLATLRMLWNAKKGPLPEDLKTV